MLKDPGSLVNLLTKILQTTSSAGISAQIHLMSSSNGPSISDANNSVQIGHVSKRRKLRKGTFSCWECKRRKTRCEFRPTTNSVCLYCSHRGLPCISQELPEFSGNGLDEVERRIVHVEGLVSQLAQQRPPRHARNHMSQQLTGTAGLIREEVSTERPAKDRLENTPTLLGVGNGLPLCSLPSPPQDAVSIRGSLSAYLHSILSQSLGVSLVLSQRKFFSLSFQVPNESSNKNGSRAAHTQELGQVSQLPPLTSHPILFAQRLIQLAICLHELEDADSTQIRGSTCGTARQYVEIAVNYVTSKDSLVNSIDGLKALMLESRYYITIGELRPAWLILRRALGIAQLIRLSQVAKSKPGPVEFLWFRLIYSERFLSLMLGLPVTVDDNSWVMNQSLTANLPFERLECVHVLIAGRIISRNLRIQSSWDDTKDGLSDEYKETQAIDHELKKATRIMPVSWWVPPTLNTGAADTEVMEVTSKLLAQMHQYYLVILTHQPYLLQCLLTMSTTEEPRFLHQNIDYTYSKLAILSASREVLSRFMLARDSHREQAFRGLDDKAFMASVALLLIHLHGHSSGQANVFEHQRSQDLGIIRGVIHFMQSLPPAAESRIRRHSIRLLNRLVDIESATANGVSYIAQHGQDASLQDPAIVNDHFELSIPYFGTIRLVRKSRLDASLPNRNIDSVPMVAIFPRASSAHSTGSGTDVGADDLFTAPSIDSNIFLSDFQSWYPSLPCMTDTVDNATSSDFENIAETATYTGLGMQSDTI
ncbi:hypothetical protein ANI_1_1524134 [Paecilomyces variotii No. 5]|uniref:Zn(2)-C6 fungal-type domain-containing protein n=1 Tax=Byssochlamys spectabilis (strain No. 5 / NBRC 109023) TaxID=1356009 RepID=V5FKK3_BYSSN|nr:hypothetical protein ANI_1_1524134 [Paecilomyces variotii No. 5]